MFHVLIIGAGTMGKTHIQAFSHMEDVKIIGVIDKKGQDVELECPVFSSFEEALMSIERIDIVDICVPTPLHLEFIKKAADAKLNIICEKPIARSLEEGLESIRYCQQKNVKLFVAHVLRFFPEYERAKELLDNNAIGKVGVARTTRAGSYPRGWNDWYSNYESSGGLILDMVIHDIDFLRWCFGDVERVYAKGTFGKGFEKLEYALITLRFKNGVIAHVEGSWAHDSFSMKFELAGTNGVIDYDSLKDKSIEARIRIQEASVGGVPVPESPLKTTPYYRELRHFMDCLKTGETPKVTADDALEAIKISLSAIESIRTNKPITIQ
ncbi:MAG: Gfo/Idh/MocA family oxidoreductase [Candidatus Cohnella colombiensis]|uniref:Gfo/Idh/MocA family oxidoreductase n=1 Tax=Candidatus Cohnella colombiensis TaxID=3121368 RepID=A0AA95JH16_9BACL|nr:MAG: Gfo/Idh/MocA family oxidoreductase [Cohnella sp.]